MPFHPIAQKNNHSPQSERRGGEIMFITNKKESQTHPTLLGMVRRRPPQFYIILYTTVQKNASILSIYEISFVKEIKILFK